MRKYNKETAIDELEDWRRDIKLTFENDKWVELNPDVYIFTGCWYIDEICAR